MQVFHFFLYLTDWSPATTVAMCIVIIWIFFGIPTVFPLLSAPGPRGLWILPSPCLLVSFCITSRNHLPWYYHGPLLHRSLGYHVSGLFVQGSRGQTGFSCLYFFKTISLVSNWRKISKGHLRSFCGEVLCARWICRPIPSGSSSFVFNSI